MIEIFRLHLVYRAALEICEPPCFPIAWCCYVYGAVIECWRDFTQSQDCRLKEPLSTENTRNWNWRLDIRHKSLHRSTPPPNHHHLSPLPYRQCIVKNQLILQKQTPIFSRRQYFAKFEGFFVYHHLSIFGSCYIFLLCIFDEFLYVLA